MTTKRAPASGSTPRTVGDALHKALVATVAGFLFSALLSTTIVLGLYFRWSPFIWFERAGVDVSYRLLSAFPETGRMAQQKANGGRFIFFDVDSASCATGARDRECIEQNPVRPPLIRAAVEGLLHQPVRAIVIDAAFDLSRQEHRALVDDLIKIAPNDGKNRSIILIPAEVRRDNGSTQPAFQFADGAWSDPIFLRRLFQSRVRFAPSIVTGDLASGDGIIRNAPRFVLVGGRNGYRAWPNLPYLIGQIDIQHSNQLIDCRFFACGSLSELSGGVPNVPAGWDDRHAPVHFVLPALSREFAEACGDTGNADTFSERCATFNMRRLALSDRYIYEPMSEAMPDGVFNYDSEVLRDATVILGTSLPSADDVHPTPLGMMPGPEILINAASMFRHFDDVREPHPIREFDALKLLITKLRGVLFPGTLIVFSAYLISLLADMAIARSVADIRIEQIARWAVTTTITVTAMLFCVFLEMRGVEDELYHNMRLGIVTDTLTPVLALLFERYTEWAKSLLSLVERVSENLVSYSARMFASLRSWTMSKRGRS